MKSLIDQAFLYVEPIGQHVHDGHYDLIGPDGEIILPQVWETMVKPDWAITMQMWPMPEKQAMQPPPGMIPPPPEIMAPLIHGKGNKQGKKVKGKSHGHSAPPHGTIPPPPMAPPPPQGMGMPPALAAMGIPPPPMGPPPPPGAGVIEIPGPAAAAVAALGQPQGHRSSKDKRKKKEAAGLALWFAGGPANRKDSLKFAKETEDGPYYRSRSADDGEFLPSAENGRPLRESAPNGRAIKGWF